MDDDEVILTQEESGLDRRTYLAIVGALASPGVAGCAGQGGDGGGGGGGGGGDGGGGDGGGGGDDTPTAGEETETPGDSQATQTAGDQANAKRGGTLQTTLESPLTSLDPAYAGLLAAYTVLDRTSEKLFRVDRDLNITNWLATGVDVSDDGLTWDVKIREGVMFHPPYKRELKAEDIVFNFDRIMDPEIGSSWQMSLNTVDSWEAVDDYTLRLNFQEVAASTRAWIGWYGGTNIMSPDAIEDKGDLKSHPVGTGPFKFEEWQTRDHITFSRFEDYWDGDLPYLDEIIYRPITEAATKITELTDGKIHIVRETPSEYIGQMQGNSGVTVGTGKSSGFRHFFLNPGDSVTKGRGPDTPTANRKVRQAINHAIDRNAMVDVIAGGFGRPGHSWFAPGTYWHVDYEPYGNASQPEEAKKLIEEAGFSTPLELSIVAASDDSVMRQMGKIARDNLAQSGFDPQLDLVEIGTWSKRFGGFQYDMCTNYMSALIDPDLMRSPWQYFQVTPYREGNTYSDQTIELYEKGRQTLDREERKEIYDELQTMMIDDATQAILYHPTYVRTYRNTVKNFRVHPFKTNFILKDVWLDE